MNILIVSGFLGAGKTTFIKELSRRTKKEFAILENEYANSGVDGDILKNSDKTVNIWELIDGCICCSAKGDFAQSILTIANTIDPDYLVVEPTGVAKLSSIIENIKQIEYDRIKILASIAIVDANSIHRYRNEFPDIYEDQIRSASTIILSKTEDFSKEELNEVVRQIHCIDDTCEITTEHYSKKSDAWMEELLLRFYDGSVAEKTSTEYTSDIDTFALQDVAMEGVEDFLIFMEQLIRGHYGNIIRAKGSISINETHFMFDVADGRYAIAFLDEVPESKAVFIGNRIKRQKIRNLLFKQSKTVKILAKR